MEIGDRSHCLHCRELPSWFPGHLAGAEPGDPTRSDTEENPNPAEHMDWVSVVLSGLSVRLQRSHGFVTMS